MSEGRNKTGQFGAGNPGKPKGAQNKVTKELKEMVLGALDRAGGEKYLVEQAHANPSAFLALIGKVLPKDVKVNGDSSITVRVVTGVPHDDDSD